MDLYTRIGLMVAAALAVILLLWYVQRVLANIRLASAQAWMPVMVSAGQAAMATSLAGAPALGALEAAPSTTGAQQQSAAAAYAAQPAPPPKPEPVPIYIPPMPEPVPAATPEDEQMQKVVIRLAEENPATVADIIHLWLSEDEKGKSHGGSAA